MPTLPDFETMYRAFLERDTAYDGVFFVGVKTTGIFCRPTCTARRPKRANVEFSRRGRTRFAADTARAGCAGR